MKRLLLILLLLSSIISFGQCPNNDNTDTDGDGVADCIDPCPILPNSIAGNLSFESDFIGWTIPQNSANFNISNTSENVLHGNNALQITAPNSATFENYAIETEQFILEQDVAYNLKIPVKRLSPLDGDAIRWALVDSDGVYRHLNNYYNTTEDWNFITIENLVVNFDFYTNDTFRLRLEFGLSTVDMVADKIEFYESIEGEDPTYQDANNDGIADCGNIDVSTHPDYNSLIDLYNSTNGNEWTNSTNWLDTSQPLSNWFGVTLTNNRVTNINLRNNNLSGTIPATLNNLTELKFIDIAINSITGEIPEELGSISGLEWLDLAVNQLTGNIPNTLTNLTELSRLSVASNQLNGSIPDFTNQNLFVFAFDLNYFQFGDFENQFNSYQNNIAQFLYAPQILIVTVNELTLDPNEDLILSSEPISGENNNYQWYFNHQPIDGATSSVYNITDFQTTESGLYYCRVSNSIVNGLEYEVGIHRISITPSLHPDYNALVDFYNATNGDNWTNNINWLDDAKPIGTWNGITETNGRVTGIDLNQNNLSGYIPESFSDFTELTLFNVRLNSLNGSLPLASFTNQTQLEYVDINSNFMSGFIPPEIGNLTNLWHLDIGWNNFTGTIPSEINNLNNIQNLYLHNNRLSGSIPISAGDLPNLQILYLADNNLAGTVPDLSGLPSLSYFAIFNNQFVFADLEPSYENLNTQLGFNYAYYPQQFIDIEKGISVNLNDTITLSSLGGLGSNLNVDWYKFDGTNYYFIESGELLDVTINSEADYGDYIYYVTSPTIPNLGLQSNLITLGPSPSIHPDYNALLAVYNALDGDNWENSWDITSPITTWDIPAGYDELIFDDSTNRLTGIILNGTDKTGSIPNEIGDLDQLTYLSLQSENITGSIPNTIGNLLNLTELWLFGNNLSGEVPTELWNLVSIKNLMIGNQADRLLTLNDGIPSNVTSLQDLEWLNLSHISVSLPFPAELFTLPNLIRLRVQGCGLTGTLPPGFAMIDDIYADGNNFSGTIPDEILNVNGNTRLSITNNYYDFSDLEPLAQSNGYQFLNYSPQRTVDEELSLESGVGSDITLNVDDTNINRNEVTTAQNNQYQWFKDNAIISGANGSSYTITNAQESDSGVYHCEITNPTLPDLTIVRAPITLLIDESLGVIDTNLNELSIYPNPVKSWLNIKGVSDSEATLTIYDLNGRTLFSKSINGDINAFNLEFLPSGTYVLNVNTVSKTQTLKFIKQ